MSKRLAPIFLALLVLLTTLSAPVAAKTTKGEGVSDTIVINAPKETVWKVVTAADKFDAAIESHSGNEAIIEQKFEKIPFYGHVDTTIKVTVKQNEQLTYIMLKSAEDRIKEMSGGWHLTPLEKNQTKLKLTSNVDPGLPIPRFLINQFIKGKVQSRLKRTKRLAEDLYASQQANQPQQVVEVDNSTK